MEKEELLELISSWDNLAFFIGHPETHPELFPLVMDIALHCDEQKSWRAAWMADKINDHFPELVRPFLPAMTEKLKTEKSDGKKRQFLKFISMNEIAEDHHSFLVDYCFEALTSAKEPTSVRVYAMQILFNISEKQPGLKPELLSVLEHELEFHATPGVLSRGRKLMKKLVKQV